MKPLRSCRPHVIAAEGMFDRLGAADREAVMEIAGNFHYRDATTQHDGSRGTVSITYNQLIDALAYTMVEPLTDPLIDKQVIDP